MTFFPRLACAALACLLIAAARPATPKEQMKFGVSAAQQGLWREAIFRWEKLAKVQPENPRVWNNLAVAYESIGDVTGARRAYREALRLSPGSKEIRDNYNSFLELCKSFHNCGDDDANARDGNGGTGSKPEAAPGGPAAAVPTAPAASSTAPPAPAPSPEAPVTAPEEPPTAPAGTPAPGSAPTDAAP